MRSEELVPVRQAAAALGVSKLTIRNWSRSGKLACVRVNERGDRRFRRADIAALQGVPARVECIALYVRVSGQQGQESSLIQQEKELRAHAGAETDQPPIVFKDKASGLNERRLGLKRLLKAAEKGKIDEVWVTHKDRLTRFGFGYLEALFGAYGVKVVVLHDMPCSTPEAELLEDFMSLIACFSGRLYGQRSAAARKRLLKAAGV